MAAPEESSRRPGSALQPPPERSIIELAICGPIAPAAVGGWCERARDLLLTTDAEVLVCDLGALGPPDLAAVDALAHIELTARRLGRSMRMRHATPELTDLLGLMGLSDVVGRG